MTVAELLKSKGIADDVIAGLPKDISSHLEGYLSDADTKLSAAAQDKSQADELRRQAELDKQEVHDYVERYGNSLNDMASAQARDAARTTYLAKLKEQGVDVPAELLPAIPNPNPNPKPNNGFDPDKFRGQIGDVMSQWMDANNEYFRLFGTPIPDQSTVIAEEAARARKPIGQYIAEKYKFRDRQTANEQKAFDDRVAAAVKTQVDAEKQRLAEERGSNPNLRTGEPSRNSFVKPIKGEEFHKSDGNQPKRERMRRMLDNIHRDIAARQSA